MDNEQPADASPAESESAKEPEAADLTVEEQLAKAKEDAEKYQQNWTRAAADLQNYRRRTDQERDEARRFASVALIINLLPVLDDFERAFVSLDARLAGLTWCDGMRLIHRKLEMLLDNAGVTPIQADGKKFDPKYHEAVQHVEGEEDGKVVAEVQRGYMLHDRVLRPAMVVVGSGKKDEAKKEEASDDNDESALTDEQAQA
ncbi:MAG: nucleotide exchange factor GrpE [Chloroflexi bacterium]|nr:nucleotide exchange factor GrpE [Chloroflexota bacterium]